MLVPGEEVTSRLGPDGQVPAHVNGFGIRHLVKEAVEGTVVHALQHNIDAIREAGGLASVNHPNYRWSIGAEELLSVDGYRFVEIYTGPPASNNDGGGGLPSTYNIWDRLLSAGKQVWGIAVDDSHHFQEEFGPERSNPGRGWVQVRTDKLDVDGVLQALDAGDPTGPGRRGFLCIYGVCRLPIYGPHPVRLPSKLNRGPRRDLRRCSRGNEAWSCTCRIP